MTAATPPPARPPYPPYRALFAGIFPIAFATLLFELALIRILSFTIWHHFGYVMISTALLGFGAAGTFVAVRPSTGSRDLRGTLALLSQLSAVSALGALLFIALAPLHPMKILERPSQAALFVAYQLAAATPFFFSGVIVTLALRAGAERVDRLYFFDLVGAGFGCLCAVVAMNLLTPPGAAIASAGVFAAASVAFADRARPRLVGALLSLVLLVGSAFAGALEFTPANSKQYSMQLKIAKMEPRFSRWTALFRTDVLEQVKPPNRTKTMAGLSRAAPAGLELPRFYISHDATAGTGIYDLRSDSELDYLEHHILRVPYLVVNPNPRVLVIGVGGGRDVIAAIQYGAAHVTGAELDPAAVELIQDGLSDATNGFFLRDDIELVPAEGRHFIRTTDARYDLIQLTGVDTLAAMNTGAYVLAENYLYTVEAFHDYLDRLEPGGILSFAMGNLNPSQPRAAGRIVAVAQQALRERGVARPQDQIAVVDSRSLYAEVMIRTTPFTSAEMQTLAEHAREHEFMALWLPGVTGSPVFRALASATGRDRERLESGLRYLLTPTRDDNPFFLSFFRWSDLFEPGRLVPSHVSALGQIVLGLLLISLTLLGAAFILVPLLVFRRRGIAGRGGARLGVMIYFLSLGLGFMLFEISLIQRFVLFLGYPTYSLTVTLSSLLIALGCGSYLSRRLIGRERRALPIAVGCIALLGVFYSYGLPVLQGLLLGSPLPVRALVTAGVLVPLGLVLGIFLPLGIRRAADIHPDLVPWAWGINGCASVTGGVLSVVLAMSYGFTGVWILSLGVYAVGVTAFLATSPSSRSAPG